MNRQSTSGIGAIALAGMGMLATGAALAGDGWYVEGGLNYSMLDDSKGTVANTVFGGAPPTTLHLVNSVDAGWGGQVAAGYKWGRFRLEAEIGRSNNDGDSYTTITPVQVTRAQEGRFDVTRYMVNANFDLADNRWNPHVGFGIGWGDVRLYAFGTPAAAPPTIPWLKMIDDSDTVFAYQFIAGVAYDFTPKVALTVRYRWFQTNDAEGLDMRGERITREMGGHNLDVGLRYRF